MLIYRCLGIGIRLHKNLHNLTRKYKKETILLLLMEIILAAKKYRIVGYIGTNIYIFAADVYTIYIYTGRHRHRINDLHKFTYIIKFMSE